VKDRLSVATGRQMIHTVTPHKDRQVWQKRLEVKRQAGRARREESTAGTVTPRSPWADPSLLESTNSRSERGERALSTTPRQAPSSAGSFLGLRGAPSPHRPSRSTRNQDAAARMPASSNAALITPRQITAHPAKAWRRIAAADYMRMPPRRRHDRRRLPAPAPFV